ncbi:(R)-mandelonitrile lyase [Acinetobacter pragensis]|uniref:(R)-mandelonitrile lyase n=1 Tax=Acinetobacter pragensis TaxID=1806892 RepID=UPI003341D18A
MNMKFGVLMATLLISIGAQAMSQEKASASQTIKKANEHQIFGGSDQSFTGAVHVELLTDVTESINASSAYVSFQANARSFWHTHPKGQYLVVTQGEGVVQEWGKAAEKVTAGDVIYCPPGVKHWHGASGHSAMTHLALTGADENGRNVDWLEPVSEQQYQLADQD